MVAAAHFILALLFIAFFWAVAAVLIRFAVSHTQLLGDRSDKLSDGGGEVPFHSSDVDQGGPQDHA